MKDGFYISAFVVVGALANAKDIKLRHDQTVALWKKDGDHVTLEHYWELERFSGWKQHTVTFSSKEDVLAVLSFLLQSVSLTLQDIQEIWGSPCIDTGHDYTSEDCYPNIAYHNICHAFTALLFDSDACTKGDMLVLALDSGPENIAQLDAYHKLYYTGVYAHGGELQVFSVQSPGKLWSNSKKKFSLREGSLMALSSASKAQCNQPFLDNVDLLGESGLENALQYLENLDAHVKKVGHSADERFTPRENFISAFMKEIDAQSKRMLCTQLDAAIKRFSIDPHKTSLGLAGGFALNCPTNTYLMNRYGFRAFIAPPCTNDSGEALGIGLYAFYKKMGKLPQVKLAHAFYGAEQTSDLAALQRNYADYIASVSNASAEEMAEDIASNVVAWVQGRAEVGPRALGHRSLFSNPALQSAKDKMNQIKQREWWRPVAPIVLQAQSEQLFEESRATPFMLEAFHVKPEWQQKAPAIVHLDGTARVQTICEADNELLHAVITAFYQKTGVPAICNTSLNDRGEPIIQTAEEALCFCLRKKIEILYVNGVRFVLKNHCHYDTQRPQTRNTALFHQVTEAQIQQMEETHNPHHIEKDILTYYFDNPEMYLHYDLTNAQDCERIKKSAEGFMQKSLISLQRELL